jgi:hypothetical protein
VNHGYLSPLSASPADLMLRPLIEGNGGTFVARAASAVGPACYEVVAPPRARGSRRTRSLTSLAKDEGRSLPFCDFRKLEPSFEVPVQ